MNNKIKIFNWREKIIISIVAILILIMGFFASLLALVIGSTIALMIGIKLWRINRQKKKIIIDADYSVINE